MLGQSIADPYGIESLEQYSQGLGLLPVATTITQEKTTILSEGELSFCGKILNVQGYEIHMGNSIVAEEAESLIVTETGTDGCKNKEETVIGTYFHGIFHNDELRSTLINHIRQEKGLDPLFNRVSFNQMREEAFDRLADHVRAHVKLDFIEEKMLEFGQRRLVK